MNVVNGVIAWFTDPANWSGPDGIPVRTLQHIWYSLLATVLAAAIALPVGVYIGHTGRGATFAVNLTNLGRAKSASARSIPTSARLPRGWACAAGRSCGRSSCRWPCR